MTADSVFVAGVEYPSLKAAEDARERVLAQLVKFDPRDLARVLNGLPFTL